MSTIRTFDDDLLDVDIEAVPLVLPLDKATVAWLIQLSGGSDSTAAELIASMIRSIREDDEWSHRIIN
jgi:hypothetical protein